MPPRCFRAKPPPIAGCSTIAPARRVPRRACSIASRSTPTARWRAEATREAKSAPGRFTCVGASAVHARAVAAVARQRTRRAATRSAASACWRTSASAKRRLRFAPPRRWLHRFDLRFRVTRSGNTARVCSPTRGAGPFGPSSAPGKRIGPPGAAKSPPSARRAHDAACRVRLRIGDGFRRGLHRRPDHRFGIERRRDFFECHRAERRVQQLHQRRAVLPPPPARAKRSSATRCSSFSARASFSQSPSP